MLDNYLKKIYDYEASLPLKIRKESGITYTPYFIVDYINKRLLEKIKFQIDADFKAIDLSCGGGVFLIDLIFKIKQITHESFKHIIEKRIYGIDYDRKAIELLRKLLVNLADTEGATLDNINLFCGNTLNRKFVYNSIGDTKFRLIPGNPPYVRIQNIPDAEREYLKNWNLISGNTDLYIPFYEAVTELLDDNGVAGYISSNTFLKNKSGVLLGEYLLGRRMVYELIDFKDKQIFANLNTYTCICLLSKCVNKYYQYKEPNIDFVVGEISRFKECQKCYPVKQNEIAISNEDIKTINRIESSGEKLLTIVQIRVGLATLADTIYFLRNGTDRKTQIDFGNLTIEKEMVKPCIKVSIIKNAADVIASNDYIIFPYKKQDGKYIPMIEEELKEFPLAYDYLLKRKEALLKRDKGKIDLKRWFLFGRTQGLNSLWGEKLLIPPLAQSPLFIESYNKHLLYLSGYAIFRNQKTPYSFGVLKKVLESNVMKIYIDKKSKKMQDGWVVYSKEFMKNFSIPKFNDKDIEFIESTDGELLNAFLMKRYKL